MDLDTLIREKKELEDKLSTLVNDFQDKCGLGMDLGALIIEKKELEDKLSTLVNDFPSVR